MSAPLRPFHTDPGRDATKDRRPEYDIGRYYYDARFTIQQDAGLLNALIGAVNAEYDLTPAQWAQWYSVALGFKPDLIVELGRSKGNSTAIFCQAASRLGGRVVSLCSSRDWIDETLPRLETVVAPGWLDVLDARITDILDIDYDRLLSGAKRVMLLWDAHGFEIAEMVLGRILPLLNDRPHLILMHDISDTRYATVSRSYEGQPLWKGSTWDTGTGKSSARVNIGWMSSLQDQVIAVADFALRNDLGSDPPITCAQFFAAHPRPAKKCSAPGRLLFSLSAHWAFLSLAEKSRRSISRRAAPIPASVRRGDSRHPPEEVVRARPAPAAADRNERGPLGVCGGAVSPPAQRHPGGRSAVTSHPGRG